MGIFFKINKYWLVLALKLILKNNKKTMQDLTFRLICQKINKYCIVLVQHRFMYLSRYLFSTHFCFTQTTSTFTDHTVNLDL